MGGVWVPLSGLQLVEHLLIKSGPSDLEAVRGLFRSILQRPNEINVYLREAIGRFITDFCLKQMICASTVK